MIWWFPFSTALWYHWRCRATSNHDWILDSALLCNHVISCPCRFVGININYRRISTIVNQYQPTSANMFLRFFGCLLTYCQCMSHFVERLYVRSPWCPGVTHGCGQRPKACWRSFDPIGFEHLDGIAGIAHSFTSDLVCSSRINCLVGSFLTKTKT